MRFRDRYPKPCAEFCPICKRTCISGNEYHVDTYGIPTAHICGAHWWVFFKINASYFQHQGYFGEATQILNEWRNEQNAKKKQNIERRKVKVRTQTKTKRVT